MQIIVMLFMPPYLCQVKAGCNFARRKMHKQWKNCVFEIKYGTYSENFLETRESILLVTQLNLYLFTYDVKVLVLILLVQTSIS